MTLIDPQLADVIAGLREVKVELRAGSREVERLAKAIEKQNGRVDKIEDQMVTDLAVRGALATAVETVNIARQRRTTIFISALGAVGLAGTISNVITHYIFN